MIDEKPPKESEIWHPHWMLEEFKSNMWGCVKNRNEWLQKAVDFTGNHNLYGSWMLRVIEEWKFSCEHNLTKPGDKRPWIGHAAVALAISCPEDITRQAWSFLSVEQQTLANKKAEEAILIWRAKSGKV